MCVAIESKLEARGEKKEDDDGDITRVGKNRLLVAAFQPRSFPFSHKEEKKEKKKKVCSLRFSVPLGKDAFLRSEKTSYVHEQ